VRLTANEVGVLKPLGGSNPLVSAKKPLDFLEVLKDSNYRIKMSHDLDSII